MITLLTKDGSKAGNAIIYGGDDGIYQTVGEVREPVPIFFVETDFGNRMRLTWAEIESMFTIGWVQSYEEWKAERDRLIGRDVKPVALP